MLVPDDKNNPLLISNSVLCSDGGKTYGFGLQLWIQELEILALDMDVSWGQNTSGIYFRINRAL
jgi:hypothetical protein